MNGFNKTLVTLGLFCSSALGMTSMAQTRAPEKAAKTTPVTVQASRANEPLLYYSRPEDITVAEKEFIGAIAGQTRAEFYYLNRLPVIDKETGKKQDGAYFVFDHYDPLIKENVLQAYHVVHKDGRFAPEGIKRMDRVYEGGSRHQGHRVISYTPGDDRLKAAYIAREEDMHDENIRVPLDRLYLGKDAPQNPSDSLYNGSRNDNVIARSAQVRDDLRGVLNASTVQQIEEMSLVFGYHMRFATTRAFEKGLFNPPPAEAPPPSPPVKKQGPKAPKP